MLTLNSQPSISGAIQRIAFEIDARLVLVLKDDGQILYHSDFTNKDELAKISALASALLSAANSLGITDEAPEDQMQKIFCDTKINSFCFCSIHSDQWLFAIYPQPHNPGKVRMILRNHALILKKISDSSEIRENELGSTVRVNLPPASKNDSGLFANITDDEIDRLFDEAQS